MKMLREIILLLLLLLFRESFAVTLLGTCSACPSHLRNVSSYYVDLFAKGGALMDCGK